MHQHHEQDAAHDAAWRWAGGEHRRQHPWDMQSTFGAQRVCRGQETERRCDNDQGGPQMVPVLRMQGMVEPQPIPGQCGGDQQARVEACVGACVDLGTRRRTSPEQAHGDAVARKHPDQQQDHVFAEDADVEDVQRGTAKRTGNVRIGGKCQLDRDPGRHDGEKGHRRPRDRGIMRPPQQQREQDDERENDRAAMGEDECEHEHENQRRAPDAATGAVTHGQRRPEQSVRHPHLGREAEYQWTKTGSRETCVAKNDAAFGTVGRKGGAEPEKLGHKEQEPIDGDTAACIPGQRDEGLGGQAGEKIDEQATRNVVPVKRPGILHRHRIGEDRAVGIDLQVVSQPDHDKQHRPGHAGEYDQGTQQPRIRTEIA